MAIVVKERPLEATSQLTPEERSAKRVFLVSDDAGANITTIQAETASGIPAMHAQHPDDPSRFAIDVTAEYLDKQRRDICVVEVSYEKGTSTLFDTEDPENPLADDDSWSIETEEWEEEYFEDEDGSIATLSNGKPMNPRPKRKAIGYKLIIQRNVVANYNLGNFGTYNNTVNTDLVSYAGQTFPVNTCHLILRLGELQERNEIEYRVLTLELTIRESGHDQIIENRDKHELLANGKLEPILDDQKHVVEFPYPLKANGRKQDSHTDDATTFTLIPYRHVAMNAFVNS